MNSKDKINKNIWETWATESHKLKTKIIETLENF
jgi:hypothetical protein